jgi:SET domain-containing protein
VILGLGSMFNHSTHEQNVVWERDTERQIMTYRALRDIPIGEELCESVFEAFVLTY